MFEAQSREIGSVARDQERERWPGAVLGVAIAVGSGLAFSVWGLPQFAAESHEAGVGNTSTLAEVAAGDVAGALSTLEISSAARESRAKEDRDCGPRLAWVSIARAPGQPPGKIRLQSGNYFSPVFRLGDRPVRVAIPYPAPYESGHGALAAFVSGGAGIVGLMPAWHVSASIGESVRNVTWQPHASCENAHG